MIKKATSFQNEFARWLVARQTPATVGPPSAFAIAIESPCVVCQPRVAGELAAYLNEFDEGSDGNPWLMINDHRLEQLQAFLSHQSELVSRIADDAVDPVEFLCGSGKVIFETPDCHQLTKDFERVFQVKLSCQEPGSGQHHLWINAKRMSPDALRLIIANSFIDWANLGGDWKPQEGGVSL